MDIRFARKYAEEAAAHLSPWCSRIEIAGSIRRCKLDVKDIEIVCIPKTLVEPDGLFDTKIVRHPCFIRAVNDWRKVKGDPDGKYTQRVLPCGLNLDLFTATEDNWGLILGIRTGSADFSHRKLACGWVANGYKSIGGMLHRDGEPVPVRTERELFEICGVPYVRPVEREIWPTEPPQSPPL